MKLHQFSGLIAGLFFFLLTLAPVYARQEVEMADTMRSEGKIYVIVGIILIVLIGLIAYLYLLDKKIRKIEDKLK
jgi:hypothetical protein